MQSVISRLQSLTLSQRLLIFAGLYTIVAANSFPDTYLKVFGTFPVFRFILFTGLIFCAGLCATALFSRPPSAFAFIRQRFAERGEGAAVIIATLVLAFGPLSRPSSSNTPGLFPSSPMRSAGLHRRGPAFRRSLAVAAAADACRPLLSALPSLFRPVVRRGHRRRRHRRLPH